MHKLTIGNSDIVDVLSSCNIYLNQLNRSDLHQSANLINLNLIFDCLNTTNKEQIENCCLMFKKLFSVLSSNQVFNKYSLSIERSLHHPDNIVKSTVLAELEKLLMNDNNIDLPLILICTLVDCLSNSDVSVSFRAVKCLKQLKCDEILSSPQILSKIRTLMQTNSEIRARIYDILVDWSMSVDALALISSKGLFSSLIPDITNPDIMMQMVTIQLLVSLGITDHGFDYLNSVGIIRGLYRLLSSSPEELNNLSTAILNPIILEFFIQIALIKPQLIYISYPKVFTVIYEIMNENDGLLVNVATNSIKVLASSWECKLSLDIPAPKLMIDQYQGKGELDIWSLFIEKLNNIVSGTKTECKASAIKAIVKIIQIENEEICSRNDMIARTKKWYKQLTNDPFKNIIYKSCSLPFLDIQEAGYEMLLKLSEQPWGQEEINNFPLIMDLVLKPHHSDDYINVKTLKQQIVKTLLESETSRDILSEDLILRIHNFSYTQMKTNVNTTSSEPGMLVEDMPQ
ncbi:Hypothetical protein CINCED_3A014253 [Cinara cedri]|nr:Hypothetical protein CINCED_3A014253 [Cinara cedri]